MVGLFTTIFIRLHLSLKGKTPAEAYGINLEIENSWENLIKEATYHQTKLTRFIFNNTEVEAQFFIFKRNVYLEL